MIYHKILQLKDDLQEEKEEKIECAKAFVEFIKTPEDPKWQTSKYLPQELVGVVVMLKHTLPQHYDESVQEFTRKFIDEEAEELLEISTILVKLQMRQS